MPRGKKEDLFRDIHEKISEIEKNIKKIIPRAVVGTTKTFGNSSHIVLSKEFVDKKVGIIIFDSETSLDKIKGGK